MPRYNWPDPSGGGRSGDDTVAHQQRYLQNSGGNGGDPVTVEAIRGKLIMNVAEPGNGDLPGDGIKCPCLHYGGQPAFIHKANDKGHVISKKELLF